ncbi:hypothetical protein [Microbacterium trichothecenolyticum]|uniref:Neutral ceramidase superfamily lipid hydrolase n=1 Tax=Microbacterium trichothecenolyticum TaxID=69370 RepID=A0ABU0TQ48_MICTR|nr:hypothetical protein [Microbacterium trichothecenolyticum]MDQ1121796.1 putative neutral ceramidase superfamily lipid hydrolase [Microbacterium trichothecenolyticum]
MRRLFGLIVVLVVAAGAAVLTWPSAFGLERTLPLAQIISFRAPLTAVFVALTMLMLLFALIRPIRALALALALVLGVAGGVNVAVVTQRGMGTEALPAKTDTSLRGHDVEHCGLGDLGRDDRAVRRRHAGRCRHAP